MTLGKEALVFCCYIFYVLTLHSALCQRSTQFWKPWSSWTTCTRSCNGGIESRHRTCRTNSEILGRNSTYRCPGIHSQHKICNQEPCTSPERSFETLCEKHKPYNLKTGVRYTWYPTRNENPCRVSCTLKGHQYSGYFTVKRENGALCERDKHRICLHGRCVSSANTDSDPSTLTVLYTFLVLVGR